MNIVAAIAGVVIKELRRRKDAYVLFVLTALITLAAGAASFFNDDKIVGYLRELCLLLIWISALVIAVTTAARQLPAERESRTLFPLLAKPVTRGQVIAGKALGCWLATGLALAVFYLFLGVVSASRQHSWPVLTYFQAFWLQWMMLGVVIAMTVLGSLVFGSPASNSTIVFLVTAGILFLGGHLNQVALDRPEPARSILYTLYFLIPHLEWFDVRSLIVHGLPPVAWWAVGVATLAAAAYSAFFLFAAWMIFRRKALQ